MTFDARAFVDGLDDADIKPVELVVERATGRVRQAGASQTEGAWVRAFRAKCEASLYLFTKVILKRDYLTAGLHLPVCRWLQSFPPYRKLLLMPRWHGKSSIVAHGLPLHVIIQPKERNRYVANIAGTDCRILLACETDPRVQDHVRVIEAALEGNELFRALWPHCTWAEPRRESKKWNSTELIVPRSTEWPDPTLRGVGVGGAITGAHPNVLIKDDLISFEAMNSPAVMHTAIQWHIASRALLEQGDVGAESSVEFIIGTRWAVHDLYQYIIDTECKGDAVDEETGKPMRPTDVVARAIVENGVPIWPERVTLSKVAAYRGEFGVLFPLLFMNSAADPELVDFDREQVREFEIVAGHLLHWQDDERDIALAELASGASMIGEAEHVPTNGVPQRGEHMTPARWADLLMARRGDAMHAPVRARAL